MPEERSMNDLTEIAVTVNGRRYREAAPDGAPTCG